MGVNYNVLIFNILSKNNIFFTDLIVLNLQSFYSKISNFINPQIVIDAVFTQLEYFIKMPDRQNYKLGIIQLL